MTVTHSGQSQTDPQGKLHPVFESRPPAPGPPVWGHRGPVTGAQGDRLPHVWLEALLLRPHPGDVPEATRVPAGVREGRSRMTLQRPAQAVTGTGHWAGALMPLKSNCKLVNQITG